jgi:hypothetical protein
MVMDMKTQKQWEDLLDGITIESSVQYIDAQEVSKSYESKVTETHIQGVMINEGLLPELGIGVRCSRSFVCTQPNHRDYAKAQDFQMAPDIEWKFFYEDVHGDTMDERWDEAEMIDILRSSTDIASFDPMLEIDSYR